METLIEKKFCEGSPVVIVSVLDWFLIAGELPCIVATTQRGVGTVPELTATVTFPEESDIAEVADNMIPPRKPGGSRLKSTCTPSMPLLWLSTTWNVTTEL